MLGLDLGPEPLRKSPYLLPSSTVGHTVDIVGCDCRTIVCVCPDSATTSNPPNVPSPIPNTISSVADTDTADNSCPHCPRTFTYHIGLVGHLRIHLTETGEPVSGAPSSTHHARLNCSHCSRTFPHRIGLFGHMRIHESGIDRSPETPTTSNTPTMPSPTLVSSPCEPIIIIITTTTSFLADIDTAEFSCPHCPRTFSSHIGLIDHLRIHSTETGEPVPGAPTYTHRTRLHCPRTFTHLMGLFGHMRIYKHLR
ncbi:hypothetical protein SprV_0200810100 [Sparganum proliferum]